MMMNPMDIQMIYILNKYIFLFGYLLSYEKTSQFSK